MKRRLVVPDVNAHPTERPRRCRYCGEPCLHRHGSVPKPVRDHKLAEATACRYKCTSCGRTFLGLPFRGSRARIRARGRSSWRR